jgi:hypothetical protein
MRLPSGDQRGNPHIVPAVANSTALDPSASDTQIAQCPERFEAKEIRRPPGEYWGRPSTTDEAMRRDAEATFLPMPPPRSSNWIRQMCTSDDPLM